MDEQDVDLAVPVSDRDHTLGPREAAVTLLEYGDYECPHCGEAHPVVKAIKARLGEGLRVVYRHFPLVEIHPHAALAAEAAEAAAARQRFWEMHELLYENQQRLTETDLIHYAVQLGLDPYQFGQDLSTDKYIDRVREDFLGGARSGVKGTPTFFINGVRHEGSYELPVLLAAVEAAADGIIDRAVAPWNFWGQVFPPNSGG